jgi:hypothetical protein
MTNKHDFTGKSIKCDTWEQMLHLAKLAEEQHNATSFLGNMYFNQDDFNGGDVYFILDTEDMTYLIQSVHSALTPIVISYSVFINPPFPTEVVEVTGCGDCPFRIDSDIVDNCSHPNFKRNSKYDQRFTTCPLLTKSITIKLKQNDTTGN